MKLLAIIVVTIFMNTCGNKNANKTGITNTSSATSPTEMESNKRNQNELILQYTEETRGAFKQVTVTKNTISYQLKRDGNIKTQPILEPQWKDLLTILNKTNINSFSKLKAPSNERARDAALIAKLRITKDGDTYSSPDFDHDNVIPEIKDIVNKLIELGHFRKNN